MSRFHENDDFDSNYCYLWDSRVRQTIKGKRGQKMLREFIDALLELPSRRLIAGNIVKNGEVCAVGALAKKRGVDLEPWDDGTADDDTTARLGVAMGLTYTLAFEMGFLNDVEYAPPSGYRTKRIKLDVPILTEPDPRHRYYGDSALARPLAITDACVVDYSDRYAFEDGCSPEERWQRMYEWACKNVRWELPVPA